VRVLLCEETRRAPVVILLCMQEASEAEYFAMLLSVQPPELELSLGPPVSRIAGFDVEGRLSGLFFVPENDADSLGFLLRAGHCFSEAQPSVWLGKAQRSQDATDLSRHTMER
jgi:hypothetical protein